MSNKIGPNKIGPWIAVTNCEDTDFFVYEKSDDRRWIAQIPRRKDCIKNAKLIESAPDLLESLEECLQWIEQQTKGIALDCKDMARVVIKKAKGED